MNEEERIKNIIENSDKKTYDYFYEKYKTLPESKIEENKDIEDIRKKTYDYYKFYFNRYFEKERKTNLYEYLYGKFGKTYDIYLKKGKIMARNQTKEIFEQLKNTDDKNEIKKIKNDLFYMYKYIVDDKNINDEDKLNDAYLKLIQLIDKYIKREKNKSNSNEEISTYLKTKMNYYFSHEEKIEKIQHQEKPLNEYNDNLFDIDALIDIKEKLKVPYFRSSHIDILIKYLSGFKKEYLAQEYDITVARIDKIIKTVIKELSSDKNKKLVFEKELITEDLINNSNLTSYELKILKFLLEGKTKEDIKNDNIIIYEPYIEQTILRKIYKIK